MLVTIHTQADGITVDVPAEVTFSGTFTRNLSVASVRVSRDSAVWDAAYLQPDGGMYVEIDTGLGRTFRGICDVPVIDETGADLRVLSISKWLDMRHVSSSRVFLSAPAATIARYAVMDGLLGMGAANITLGSLAIGSPHVDDFEFSGQTVLDVLTSLTELTGQEWMIDNRLRFHWQARQGVYREVMVTDDGDFGVGSGLTLDDLAREVIEVQPDGRQRVVRNLAVPAMWPRQEVTNP